MPLHNAIKLIAAALELHEALFSSCFRKKITHSHKTLSLSRVCVCVCCD